MEFTPKFALVVEGSRYCLYLNQDMETSIKRGEGKDYYRVPRTLVGQVPGIEVTRVTRYTLTFYVSALFNHLEVMSEVRQVLASMSFIESTF